MNLTTINRKGKEAFHAAGYKGQGITVALVDSGCNLKDSCVTCVFDAPDTQNHGTMIAKLLLEWLPEARILSYNIKAFSVTDALKDILYRAKQGGRYLVNISQGMGYDAEHERLINELVALNVPVFVAAGNDGNESIGLYPSHYYAPICVAALDNTGERANFSTFHNEVDFAEVGTGVVVDGKVYNGTSVACPILLAKAALILCGDPKMTEPQLYAALKAQAADLGAKGKDPYTGWGHVAATPKGKEKPMDFTYVTDTGLVWPRGRVERTKTDHIQIHHTVGDYGTPAKWKRLHESRYAAGNKGVSYSYLVLADGTIYEGRGHQYSHGAVKDNITNKSNQRSVSIAFNGDMRKAGNPTEAAKAAAKRLINDLRKLYNLPASAVIGHNEEPVYVTGTDKPTGKFYATLCPCIDMKAFRVYLGESDKPEPVASFPALYSYAGETYVRLRDAPQNGSIIGQVSAGDEVIVLAEKDGWFEVIKHKNAPMLRGWCASQYLKMK